MKVGGFIFGASAEHQKQQRQRIKATYGGDSEIKWFTEEQGHQKRDPEDRRSCNAPPGSVGPMTPPLL